ncbi:MAG: RHS repeat-associated core domain-containing protein [Deltaproteobacteria bacterium]|nr:RHS repeat-associated core domain-containing protein [Deltaproteobacteria bacterium]
MKNSWKIGMGSVIFSLGSSLVSAGVVYYHPDHLGSAITMTNERAEITEAILYTPFGEVSHKSVPEETASVPFRFTDQELDSEAALHYYGARYYDTALTRFISVDPAESNPRKPQSLNSYTYAINNPVAYLDPDGKEPKSYDNLYGAFYDQYGQSGEWGEPFKVPSLFGDLPVKWVSFPTDIKFDKEGGASFTLRPVDPETGKEFFTRDPNSGVEYRYSLEIQLPPSSFRRGAQKTSGEATAGVEDLARSYNTFRALSSVLDDGCGYVAFYLMNDERVELNLRTGIFTPVVELDGKAVKKVVFGLRLIREEGTGDEPSEGGEIWETSVYERELPVLSPSALDLLSTLQQERSPK